MTRLYPNKRYRILYAPGHTYVSDTVRDFETLDSVPEAKHLIKVRDVETGKIVDLTDFLIYPWLNIEEVNSVREML